MTTPAKRKPRRKKPAPTDPAAAPLALTVLMDCLDQWEWEVQKLPGLDPEDAHRISCILSAAWHEIAMHRPKVPAPRLLAKTGR